MEFDYSKLLKRGREKLPEKVFETSRFEPPEASVLIQGSRTYISNLPQIAEYLRRDIEHVVKFISNELATFIYMEGKRAVLTGKFPARVVNEKLQKYIKEFVICPECKKADTKMERQDRVSQIKCIACGARRPIRTIK